MNISVIGFAILGVAAICIWGYARIRPNVVAPLGVLTDRLMSRRRTRIAIIAVWWWLGWHFFSNVPLASPLL
jgi:hypothetical protein